MDFEGKAQSGMTSSGGRKKKTPMYSKQNVMLLFLAQYLFLKPIRANNNSIENDLDGQKYGCDLSAHMCAPLHE